MGDRNADIIADLLHVEKWDSKNKKGCCPWHEEDTPSFIYNPKTYSTHCFGCSRNTDIIDAYMHTGLTYVEALQKLFEEAKMDVSLGEKGVKTKHQYNYPREEPLNGKEHVYAYLGKRGISKETIDQLDVREDPHGNIAFNYYDTNDTLCMVKYRPSHKIHKETGEIKSWCQKGADTSPLLFNMNRVNSTQPLLIVEGEIDSLAAIESGFTNAVSVPFGAGNFAWIEENFEWLEQFDSIIICSDNDEAGIKMQKECVYRLGSWRTKVVDIPHFHIDGDKKIPMKDLNHVLYYEGKQAVLDLIQNAKESPVDSVSDFSDISNVDLDEIDGVKTGIPELDRRLMKLFYGTLTIVTGVNGCVSCDTEYFNGKEWKPISEYEEGDKVLQYNEDGTAELVFPEKYHKYPADHLWHVSTLGAIDQQVSEEHKLVYLRRGTHDSVAKMSVAEFMDRERRADFPNVDFINTFRYEGHGIDLPVSKIRLMIAASMFGHVYQKECGPVLSFYVLTKREKEHIKSLLTEESFRYEIEDFNWCQSSLSEIRVHDYCDSFPQSIESWFGCSREQLSAVADEIKFWKHLRKGKAKKIYSTENKRLIDFFQFALSSSNVGCFIERLSNEKHEDLYVLYSSEKETQNTIRSRWNKVPTSDGYKYCFTVPSGMLVLRHNGRINITGNSGKSSFLSQLVCNAIDEEKNAFLYSGELPNFQSKNWINYILAGQRYVNEYSFNGAAYWKVTQEAQRAINDYYRGRLFIYKDGRDHKVESLLKAMEDTTRKYGCKLHVIDNLTAVNLEANEQNKYQKQEEFVVKLINFAKLYNVAVVLVVHPHKIDQMRRLNKMDIQGISAIIDLAHRILSLYRVTKDDKRGIPNRNKTGWVKEPIPYDVICDILKDRLMGFEGSSAGLFYDRPSRRFFIDEESLDKKYGWDKSKDNSPLPYPPPQLVTNQEDEVYGEEY